MGTSKRRGSVKEGEELLTKEDIKELTEAMIENLADEQMKKMDCFDEYVLTLRSKVHSNVEMQQERFVRGYRVLLKVFVDSVAPHQK